MRKLDSTYESLQVLPESAKMSPCRVVRTCRSPRFLDCLLASVRSGPFIYILPSFLCRDNFKVRIIFLYSSPTHYSTPQPPPNCLLKVLENLWIGNPLPRCRLLISYHTCFQIDTRQRNPSRKAGKSISVEAEHHPSTLHLFLPPRTTPLHSPWLKTIS